MSIIGRNIREMPKSTMSKFWSIIESSQTECHHSQCRSSFLPSAKWSWYATYNLKITVVDFYTYKYTRELAIDCRHFTNLNLVYVTRQVKIGLVCAIYTSSHSTYLTFYVRYTSSVNCINFHTVGCTSCKSFIDKIMFRHKVMKLPNCKKRSNVMCT